MDTKKTKTDLYVIRTFGDKFTATFDFISENRRTLLKFIAYMLLPICFVQALSLNEYMSVVLSQISDGFSTDIRGIVLNYGILLLLDLIGCALLVVTLFGLMRLYYQREDRLVNVTMHDFLPELKRGLLRYLVIMIIVLSLLSITILVLEFFFKISIWLFLLTVPIFICGLSLIFPLLSPIYLIEDISIYQAIRKTLRLSYHTFGGIIAVMFAMSVIAGILIWAVSLPWTICSLVKSQLFLPDSDTMGLVYKTLINLLVYVLGVVNSFGMYLSYALIMLVIAFQYGHAAEKVDTMSVDNGIDNFESLSDSNTYEPEIDNFEHL